MKTVEYEKQVLEQAKAIALSLVGTHPVRVYLFGSRARTNPRRFADIDIAIEGGADDERARLIVTLREAFEESTVPYKVDVVDLNEVDQRFRSNVMTEGILWKD